MFDAGSADRTVRFWDLETFELIGTAGPEVLFILLKIQKLSVLASFQAAFKNHF